MEDVRPTDSSKKTYLGDGVYAAFDGQRLILTAENGVIVTNRLWIDWEVWAALKQYVNSLT